MVELPNTIVDLHNTMVDLPNTMVDLPSTMVDLPNTMVIESPSRRLGKYLKRPQNSPQEVLQ